MPVNTVRIAHGTSVLIGSANSATRITSGGTAIANPLTATFGGMTVNLATSEPTDASLVRKAKGIRNPGTVTLTFLKDSDNAGQVALLAAYRATGAHAFRIDDSGNLISFEGLVTNFNSYSAGGGSDYIMIEATVELTTEPGG